MPTITPAQLRRLLNSRAEDPVLFVNREVDWEPELDVWAAADVDQADVVITREALLNWLGEDWTDDEIGEYLEELQETVDGIAPEPGPHFTAWLTVTSGELEGDDCDVTVLPDEVSGWKRGKPQWTSTGDPVMHALTGVPVSDGDPDDAMRRAEELLEAAGWRLVGKWEGVDTGCIVEVERADQAETWPLDRVVEYIDAGSASSARKTLSRWGVQAIGRQPGRGGQNLYLATQVIYAHATRPGQGTRTDLKDAK